jgi:hypothetical protein
MYIFLFLVLVQAIWYSRDSQIFPTMAHMGSDTSQALREWRGGDRRRQEHGELKRGHWSRN